MARPLALLAGVIVLTSCASGPSPIRHEHSLRMLAQARVPGLVVGNAPAPEFDAARARTSPPGLTVWEGTAFVHSPRRTYRWNDGIVEIWVTYDWDESAGHWRFPTADCPGLEADLQALVATMGPSGSNVRAVPLDVMSSMDHSLPWHGLSYKVGSEDVVFEFYNDQNNLWDPMQRINDRLHGCVGDLWPDLMPKTRR
jgi:hypothetical protein